MVFESTSQERTFVFVDFPKHHILGVVLSWSRHFFDSAKHIIGLDDIPACRNSDASLLLEVTLERIVAWRWHFEVYFAQFHLVPIPKRSRPFRFGIGDIIELVLAVADLLQTYICLSGWNLLALPIEYCIFELEELS